MGPVLIWPNITIVVNVVFQEILALTRLWHIVSSKMITVQKKKNIVISNIYIQMICDIPVLFGKWNSQSSFWNTSHVPANHPFLSYWHFVPTNQRTVIIRLSPPRKIYVLITYRNIPFKTLYKIYIIFFLSIPFLVQS